jgi:ubiquinone/menaquinone biosynthesis C-methylase UbiE
VEFYKTEVGLQVLETEVELLLDWLPEEGRVLSIGCGIGVHESELKRRRPDLDLVCSDIQREMLAQVSDEMPRVWADMTVLPFADGTFDVVYEVTALVFVPALDSALHEMTRVLRPGGLLLLLSLNPVSKWGQDRLKAHSAPWTSLEGLVAMVEDATDGKVVVDHLLNLENEGMALPSTGLDDAAIIVLASRLPEI